MNGNNGKPGNRNLSRYQSTFLRQLPMTLEKLQRQKQTHVRACFVRELFEIRKRMAIRTALGDELLKETTHADVSRSRSMFDAPFTGILSQIVDVARQEKQGLRVVPKKAAKAA